MKFVLDTNIYLHYNLFTDCDWKVLLNENNLTLIVTPTIMKELDDKKFDSRDHINKRAQRVISKFREIRNGAKVPCEISIDFTNIIVRTNWDSLGLNPLNADDRIIAEVLELQKQFNNEDIIIITADAGLEFKASSYNIQVRNPPDEWKRTTKDPRDEEIKKLRELVKSTIPDVDLYLFDGKACTHNLEIPIQLGVDNIFSDEYIDKKVSNIEDAVQTEVNSRSYDYFTPAEEIKRYKREMKSFPRLYREYLQGCNHTNMRLSLMVKLPFILYNRGNTPAKDIDLWLKFPNNIDVLKEPPTNPKEPDVPAPPKTLVNIADFKSRFNLMDLINSKSDIIGPEIEKLDSISVHYGLKGLKHGLKHPLSLFVVFPSEDMIQGFSIEYSLNIGNYPEDLNGKLSIKLNKLKHIEKIGEPQPSKS